jgi:probable phosphoglycerate mutase
LIVAHGAMNKAILTYVKKLEKKDFWSGTFQKNCAVTVIEIKDAKMRILEEGNVLA